MPGIAKITGARVLAEFGDGPTRYAGAKARKLRRHQPCHPGLWQEIYRPSRYVRNNRLADALQR
jgi:hypothetical protein